MACILGYDMDAVFQYSNSKPIVFYSCPLIKKEEITSYPDGYKHIFAQTF